MYKRQPPGQAEAILTLSLALAQGRNPAQLLEFDDEKYVWLPYQKVTLETIDTVIPPDP